MVKENTTTEVLDNHKIEIDARTHTTITGITNVESASESGAVMFVGKIVLTIDGENLKVQKIDVETGIVELVGTINNIRYSNTKKKTGLLKKLIKGK